MPDPRPNTRSGRRTEELVPQAPHPSVSFPERRTAGLPKMDGERQCSLSEDRAMQDDFARLCDDLERQSHHVVAFVAATKVRWGENSWTVMAPHLASAWAEIPWANDYARWPEIREFVREIWNIP